MVRGKYAGGTAAASILQVVEKVVFPKAGQKHPDARRAKS